MKTYFIYILTNNNNSTFYIGITNNLERRVYEHKIAKNSFVSRYKLHKLIYFEEFTNPTDAISREKQLKNWHRDWKINLIKSVNPLFDDLFKP